MILQRYSFVISFALILFNATGLNANQSKTQLINKSHLMSLVEKVNLNGDSVYVIDIYSDYPSYKPVQANGEGFACVDDAARAIVFLVNYDECLKSEEDAGLVTGLVKFLLKMQTPDGTFYNFVERKDGRVVINRTGLTSRASFGWWAARAIWALGTSALYLEKYNPIIHRLVVNALNRSKRQVDSVLSSFGKADSSGVPTWLVYGDGADVSSELLLGLNEAFKATGDSFFLASSEKIADGLLRFQRGNCSKFPFFAFMSNKLEWHAWANSQSAALLNLYRIKPDSGLLNAALREVNCFLPRWAGALFFREFHIDSMRVSYNGQIAYNIRPALMAAVEAYQVTGDEKYKTLALIISSWFFGNNTAKAVMYSNKNGICFDGIEDSIKVNFNSGAESTIEALYSMLLLNKVGAGTVVNVKYLSKASIDAKEFFYFVNGQKLALRILQHGFQITFIPSK